MPSLGQTSDELQIVIWLKAEGEPIRLGEPLLEVETDKATIAVEAYVAGTLLKVVRHEGETVQVGEIVAYIGQPGEIVDAEAAAQVQQGETPAPSPEEAAPAPENIPADAGAAPDRVQASPAVRRLAHEHGIDLAHVHGTGPGGRIEKADILALVNERDGAMNSIAPEAVHAAYEVVPRSRQLIAQRLTESVRTIPQITLTVGVDMSRARACILRLREEGLQGLTYTHLILRAMAHALHVHPELQRLWVDGDDGPRYRRLERTDVGLAVAGNDTLLVVTIPEPAQSSLRELVGLTTETIHRARSGMLSEGDTKPSAITLSNLGMYRVDQFRAIVDPAQTAILATGRVTDQLVAVEGAGKVRPRMQMSLSVDHRVVDGAAAARFLDSIARGLEEDVEGQL